MAGLAHLEITQEERDITLAALALYVNNPPPASVNNGVQAMNRRCIAVAKDLSARIRRET